MINFHKDLVATLSTILPTFYEMTLTSNSPTPCISYLEISNIPITEAHFTNATIGYSRISYQVKVWATDLETLQNYALEIDKKLRPLGWKRTSTTELCDNLSSMVQKVMNYECIAQEKYTEV